MTLITHLETALADPGLPPILRASYNAIIDGMTADQRAAEQTLCGLAQELIDMDYTTRAAWDRADVVLIEMAEAIRRGRSW